MVNGFHPWSDQPWDSLEDSTGTSIPKLPCTVATAVETVEGPAQEDDVGIGAPIGTIHIQPQDCPAPETPNVETGPTQDQDMVLDNIPTQIAHINQGGTTIEQILPFSPDDLTGLQIWVKADGTLWQDSARTVPAVANNDPIGCWDDASGNGVNLLQATAGARPLYKTGIQNGLPGVQFDGTNDFLMAAVSPLITLPALFTIFIVVKMTTMRQVLLVQNLAADRHTFIHGDPSTATVIRYRTPALRSSFNAAAGWANGAARSIRTSYGGSHTLHNLFVNNVAVAITDAEITNPSLPIVGEVTLGSGTGANFCAGSVLELLIYDSVLSAGDIADVEAYLNEKWVLY